MDDDLPEHVRDFKLETRYSGRGQIVHFVNDPEAPALSAKVKEYWEREKRPIGRGGQGQVALQLCISGPQKNARRAVKKIPLEDSATKRRYITELKTNIKFSHDRYSTHFVRTLGWYESKEHLYIAMEYFPAGDLKAYLNDNHLSEDEAQQITVQVLRGLEVMHRENYAHRDVKPQNVLIHQHPGLPEHDSWWVKLADFGISKKIGATKNGASSTVIGTEAYMAPELFLKGGNSSVGFPAADMWALGVMTYFILTKDVIFSDRRALIDFENKPDEFFSTFSLVGGETSSDGLAFVRALLQPKAEMRPDCAVARCHPWIQPWMPSEQDISDTRSESSGYSFYSEESEIYEERGLTTQPSLLTASQTAVRIEDIFISKTMKQEEAGTLHENIDPKSSYESSRPRMRRAQAEAQPQRATRRRDERLPSAVKELDYELATHKEAANQRSDDLRGYGGVIIGSDESTRSDRHEATQDLKQRLPEPFSLRSLIPTGQVEALSERRHEIEMSSAVMGGGAERRKKSSRRHRHDSHEKREITSIKEKSETPSKMPQRSEDGLMGEDINRKRRQEERRVIKEITEVRGDNGIKRVLLRFLT